MQNDLIGPHYMTKMTNSPHYMTKMTKQPTLYMTKQPTLHEIKPIYM